MVLQQNMSYKNSTRGAAARSRLQHRTMASLLKLSSRSSCMRPRSLMQRITRLFSSMLRDSTVDISCSASDKLSLMKRTRRNPAIEKINQSHFNYFLHSKFSINPYLAGESMWPITGGPRYTRTLYLRFQVYAVDIMEFQRHATSN